MCGFVVIAQSGSEVHVPLLNHMADALTHRGPDGSGYSVSNSVGMHHKRLAIIDPVGGQQPMIADGVALVFNGEIYNYRELRKTLQALGQQFTSQSDTEVLLRAYLQWGQGVVAKLNGMFSFVLHDRRRGQLLAARDPFGIKPLYRARIGSQLIYASEIKALLRHPDAARSLDSVGLEDYLSLQLVIGERTMFCGIEKLQPAHFEVTDLQSSSSLTPKPERYWSLSLDAEQANESGEHTREIGELLAASVNRQMRSDVPVGAMLSGGLDSSMICALANQTMGQEQEQGRSDSRDALERRSALHTFTGAFTEGAAFDESPHARVVAEHLGAQMHITYPTGQQFVDQLESMVYAMDEPTAGPGLFPQFVVAQAASEHVRVCLGGQGGDEIFVGYARYLIGALQESLGASIRGEPMTKTSLSLSEIEPVLGGLMSYQPLMKRVLGAGLDLPGHERYFQIINRLDSSADLLSGSLREQMSRSRVSDRFEATFNSLHNATHLKKMMHFDLTNNLPALLHVEDRASMAASIESRVPFLDTALVERVLSVPDRTMLEGGFSKAMLRAVAQPWLPKSIVNRTDKMGFPVPLQHWVRGPAREFVRDTLLSQRARERGLFDSERMAHLIDHENQFGRALWGALQLELWHRQFIDSDHQVSVFESREPALAPVALAVPEPF